LRTDSASKAQIVLAWSTVVLMIVFVALGFAWHGFSAEVLGRIWRNVLERPAGPMTFRFILQPVMATMAALYDGVKDARIGRSRYLWTILTLPEKRGGRLREGLISTARIILLGLAMDTIYQAIVLDYFHPAEAVVIALLLAFVPYVLLRGPAARVARWWLGADGARNIR
jgi:hypothetical protein